MVSDNSAKILLKKVISDFNAAIKQVSLMQEIGESETFELSEEQFASIFACMGFFRDLNTEQHLYDEMVNLCTPKATKRLCLSIRNTKGLVLAINNIH